MTAVPERNADDWAMATPATAPVYRIDQRPARWWETALYAWQHTLVDISPFVLPLAVAEAVGMDASTTAAFISFCLIGMGIATLVQTTVGNRLPLIQGPSATITGTLAPLGAQLGAGAMWGAAFVGGLVEALLGASRVIGTLRRFFPPTVAGVVVTAIGLALGQVAVRLAVDDGRALNFALAALVIAVIAVLRLRGRGVVARGAIFIAIWAVGLGVGSLLGEVTWALVVAKPWLAWPRLFPFGGPGFGWSFVPAAILAALAGYLGSMVESVGDYAATCAVAGERYTARHMNRGITAEGLGCMLATALGGLPVTSYTQNIGIIATTRVASRFVVQGAAVILLLYGLSPKFGALLVALPRPVLGGVFIVVCGTIVLSGLRLIAAGRDGPASDLIVGTTLVLAVALPVAARVALGGAWLSGVPVLARLLVTNPVVIAVVLAVGLNAIVGVVQPRGARSG